MDRILIVEDTAEFQLLIRRALGPLAAELAFAGSCAEALAAVRQGSFNLVLLDLGLPDGDGFALCQEIQNTPGFSETPIIFLTGKNDPSAIVAGFSLGAEDFVTKPFNPLALRARVEARLQKRRDRKERGEIVEVGGLRADLGKMEGFVAKGTEWRALELTPTEFKILHHLARNAERVLSRDRILVLVWGEGADVYDRTVDSHVSSLRKKLAGAGADAAIESVTNEGYRLRPLAGEAIARPRAKKAA